MTQDWFMDYAEHAVRAIDIETRRYELRGWITKNGRHILIGEDFGGKSGKSVDKKRESGIIGLEDSSDVFKPVTQEAIDSVKKLDIFDDDEMNKRHQQAAKDLLSEVMSHNDVSVGTEFSIRYDENMKPLPNEKYRKGEVGSVKVSELGYPFHAFHNHGSDESLSIGDMIALTRSENMISITAVGNNGSIFSLAKGTNSDPDGFINYLTRKVSEPFFKFGDVEISSVYMADKEKWDKLYSKFDNKQKREFQSALAKFSYECAEGGNIYGYRFKYQKT